MQSLLQKRGEYIIGALAVFTLAVGLFAPKVFSQSPFSITGYIWSDTIGWVSAHCSDLGVCGVANYGLSINNGGQISGYAWSENVGWISANSSELNGCPQAPCTARFNGGDLSGWMKAIAGSDAQSGGWDGFISLSGSNYGPTLEEDGSFSGFAWGSDIVGWADFSFARTDYQPCQPQFFCSGEERWHRSGICEESLVQVCEFGCSSGACSIPPSPQTLSDADRLRATPFLVRPGQTSNISWNVSGADECTVSGNGDEWNAVASPQGGFASSPVFESQTYTLNCTSAGGTLGQTATVSINPQFREF